MVHVFSSKSQYEISIVVPLYFKRHTDKLTKFREQRQQKRGMRLIESGITDPEISMNALFPER
jgi:hypothetical protein